MVALLPSEVARLVLGYLEARDCSRAYDVFLDECVHLEECRGRQFYTTIMGLTLDDIVDDYCAIHAYVNKSKCHDALKKEISRCSSLMEKVKALVENAKFVHNKDEYPPDKRSNSSFPAFHRSTTKYRQRSRSNSNSSDNSSAQRKRKCTKESVFTRISLCKKSNSVPNIDDFSTRTTNLFDLPGYKNDIHNKRLKKPENDSPRDTADKNKKINKPHSSNICKEISHAEEVNRPSKPATDTKEIDFRYALGLVKNDSQDVDKTSPSKRKTIKPFSSFSLKKSNQVIDNMPNTINFLLDCKEIQEKIAKNINQMINPLDETLTPDNSLPPFKELSKANDPLITDEDTQNLDGVIKAILEKTEKDPIFDRILNDILVANVESNSGSDSEAMSISERSSAEKSNKSEDNPCSPKSYESAKDNKSEEFSWRTNVDREIKPCVNFSEPINSKDQSKIDTAFSKKYPPKPRGGKRMDVLRQSYAECKIEHSNDSVISLPSDNESITPPSIKDNPKVVILSNESVKSNIKEVLHDGKSFSKNIEVSHLLCNEVTNIDCDSKTENAEYCSFQHSKMNPLDQNSNESDKGKSLPVIKLTEVHTTSDFEQESDKLKTSDSLKSALEDCSVINAVQKYPKIITGKPPELIITSKTILENVPGNNILYSEAEIMKMPTIFVLKPDVQPVLQPQQSKPWNSLSKEENLAIKTYHQPSKGKFIPILPKVTNSDSILRLLSSNNTDIEKNSYDSAVLNFVENKAPSETNTVNISINISEVQPKTSDDILASSFRDEFIEADYKTNTPDKNTFKKLCSSTPTRKNSHVRLLDFNTPIKSAAKKRSLTSPKKSKHLVKRRGNNKTKACLFTTVKEETLNESHIVSEELLAPDDKENADDSAVNSLNLHSVNKDEKIETTSKKIDPSIKKCSRYDWDKDLRALATSGNTYDSLPSSKKKARNTHRKITKKVIKPTKLLDSNEIAGKQLEKALMDSSFTIISPQKASNSVKKSKVKKSNKRLPKIESPMKDSDISNSISNSSLIDVEDSVNHNSKKKPGPPSSLRNTNNTRIEKKNYKKKSTKNKSPRLKVKLGTKIHSDVKKQTSEAIKVNKRKSLPKKEDIDKLICKESIVTENEVEIHITPEFPREFRAQPSEIKFNMSSFLETPFKTNLLDLSIATPKFLSPDLPSEPISAIKILGIPTPNFDTSFLIDKMAGSSYTPDSHISRQTDYSSGGSYYKPDEVDIEKLKQDQEPQLVLVESSNINKKAPEKKVQKKKSDNLKRDDEHKAKNPRTSLPTNKLDSNTSSHGSKSARVLRSRSSRSRLDEIPSSSKRTSKNSLEKNYETNIQHSFPEKKKSDSTTVPEKISKSDMNAQVYYEVKNSANLEETKNKQRQLLEEKKQRIISKLNSEREQLNKKKTKKDDLFKKSKELRKNYIQPKVTLTKFDIPSKNMETGFPIALCDKVKSLPTEIPPQICNYLPISKSRRKSSTPRKLEKSIYESVNLAIPMKNPDLTVLNDISIKKSDTCAMNDTIKNRKDDVPGFVRDITILPGFDVFIEYEKNNALRPSCNITENNTLVTIEKSNFQINLENEELNTKISVQMEKRAEKEFNKNNDKIVNDNENQAIDLKLCNSFVKAGSNDHNLSDNSIKEESISFSGNKCLSITEEINQNLTNNLNLSSSSGKDSNDESNISDNLGNENKVEMSLPLIENEEPEKNVQHSECVASDQKIEVEDEDDVIVWCNTECNPSSSNFKFVKHDKNKIRKRSIVNLDMNSYLLNVNIYNSVKNIEETRVIKANNFECLMDITPKSELNTNISNDRGTKRNIMKNDQSLCEKKISNVIQDPKRNENKVKKSHDRSETEAAVSAILEDPCHNSFDISFGESPRKEKCFVEQKKITTSEPAAQKTINQQNPEDDLMNYALTGSTSSKQKNESTGDGDVKKSKAVIPQNFLKEMDIEDILSQLHPG